MDAPAHHLPGGQFHVHQQGAHLAGRMVMGRHQFQVIALFGGHIPPHQKGAPEKGGAALLLLHQRPVQGQGALPLVAVDGKNTPDLLGVPHLEDGVVFLGPDVEILAEHALHPAAHRGHFALDAQILPGKLPREQQHAQHLGQNGVISHRHMAQFTFDVGGKGHTDAPLRMDINSGRVLSRRGAFQPLRKSSRS